MSTYDYTFKVLLLGDESAEKNAVTKRYCYNIFNPSERLTIGVDFHVKTIEHQGRKIKLQIWDVGGEERFRFLLPTYCLGANAAFLLYDITRPPTLDNIPEWVKIVRQKAGSIPIMLIGSKLDLAENQRRVSREYGIQIAEINGFSGFAEVSSKTGQNISQIFEVMAEAVLAKVESNRTRFTVVPKSDSQLHDTSYINQPIIGKVPSEFKVNKFLSLQFENNKTNIYVSGKLFRQCKYLLLNITGKKSSELEKIESIDEAEVKLNRNMENDHSLISSETEFWGHCSNLQAWNEHNYDTRLLHRNLAFPLLRELVKAGDILAIKVFKEEIAKRLESGYPSVVLYLIEENYIDCFNEDELDALFENPKFLKNLSKWFSKKSIVKIPEKFAKRIKEKLQDLYCPYCDCKIEQNIVQKVLNGKGIRCPYCFTCIIKEDRLNY